MMKRFLSLAILFLCATAIHAQTPTLVQYVYMGHMDLTPTSTPSTFVVKGWNSTLANNLLIMPFLYCTGATNCSSATTEPPSITSVKDNNNTTWTIVGSGPLADNGTDFIDTAFAYCAGCSAGVTSVTVTFGTANIGDFHPEFGEFYNVSTSSPLCGTSVGTVATAPTVSAGSITLSQTGCLFFQEAMYVSNGMASNPAAVTAFSGTAGINWLVTDVSMDAAAGYKVFSSSGSQSLSFTLTGLTNDVNVIAVAFKAASAGTAPSGVYIDSQYYVTAQSASPETFFMPVPSGDAIVMESTNIGANITAASDTTNSNYTLVNGAVGNPSYAYFCGALSGNPLQMSETQNSTGWLRILSIHGIKSSSCGDTSRTCSAPSSTFGSIGCTNSGTSVPPWNNAPNITPSAAGIVLALVGVGTGPNDTPTTPSGAVGMFVTYTGRTDAEKYSNGDGWAWFLSSASAETWDWPNANGSTSTSWNATAISLLAAPAGGTTPSINKRSKLDKLDACVTIWDLMRHLMRYLLATTVL